MKELFSSNGQYWVGYFHSHCKAWQGRASYVCIKHCSIKMPKIYNKSCLIKMPKIRRIKTCFQMAKTVILFSAKNCQNYCCNFLDCFPLSKRNLKGWFVSLRTFSTMSKNLWENCLHLAGFTVRYNFSPDQNGQAYSARHSSCRRLYSRSRVKAVLFRPATRNFWRESAERSLQRQIQKQLRHTRHLYLQLYNTSSFQFQTIL